MRSETPPAERRQHGRRMTEVAAWTPDLRLRTSRCSSPLRSTPGGGRRVPGAKSERGGAVEHNAFTTAIHNSRESGMVGAYFLLCGRGSVRDRDLGYGHDVQGPRPLRRRDHARHGCDRARVVGEAALGGVSRHGKDEEVLRARDGILDCDTASRSGARARDLTVLRNHDRDSLGGRVRIRHARHLRGRGVRDLARLAPAGRVDRHAGHLLEHGSHLRDGRGRIRRGCAAALWSRRARGLDARDAAMRRRDGGARALSRLRAADRLARPASARTRTSDGGVRRERARVLPQTVDLGNARFRVPVPLRRGLSARRGAALSAGESGRRRRRPLAREQEPDRRHALHGREHRRGAARRTLRREVRPEADARAHGAMPERATCLLCGAQPAGGTRALPLVRDRGAAREHREVRIQLRLRREHALHDAADRAGIVPDDALRVRDRADESRADPDADGERPARRRARIPRVLPARDARIDPVRGRRVARPVPEAGGGPPMKRELLFAVLLACAARAGAEPAPGNPFAGADFYVSPKWKEQIETAAATAPEKAALVRSLSSEPVALWINSIDVAKNAVPRWLDEARGKLAVLVLYDLPNRDCAAQASAGELGAGDEARYRAEVVDPLAAQLRAHPDQRVAIVIEPDSLANLVTNAKLEKCAASDGIYRGSIAYAISSLSLPNVSLYLDAGHSGWLGWDAHSAKVASVFKDVLDRAGGVQKIRGFAINVSGYGVLRGDDGRRLEPSNPCPDELTYVDKLSADLAKVGITGKAFVIDTSRNGRAGIRSKSGHWCNVKGAGLGERPRAAPAPNLDAYFWIKVPGESDGTSDANAPGFDATCASDDATPGAPAAGQFFPSYFVRLVENANPPL